MTEPNADTQSRRWLIVAAKAAVAGVVLWFVADAVWRAAGELSAASLRPRPGLLVLSGAVYLIAYLPMAWFWRRTLVALGQPARWADVLPAYYLGHLGKYVPGKAMVVVLRTGRLRDAGGQSAPIAVSVFVETLTMMAVGGVVASLLLLTVFGAPEQQAWLAPMAVGLAAVAATPTLPPVMRRVIARIGPKGGSPASAEGLTWGLLGAGWLAALATWAGLAASLWLVLRSLEGQFPLTAAAALRCLLAAALPVVAGFLSLIPGGFGVRDGLMFALLKPLAALSEPVALAATVLLRLIWVASEALACVILEIGRRLGR